MDVLKGGFCWLCLSGRWRKDPGHQDESSLLKTCRILFSLLFRAKLMYLFSQLFVTKTFCIRYYFVYTKAARKIIYSLIPLSLFSVDADDNKISIESFVYIVKHVYEYVHMHVCLSVYMLGCICVCLNDRMYIFLTVYMSDRHCLRVWKHIRMYV